MVLAHFFCSFFFPPIASAVVGDSASSPDSLGGFSGCPLCGICWTGVGRSASLAGLVAQELSPASSQTLEGSWLCMVSIGTLPGTSPGCGVHWVHLVPFCRGPSGVACGGVCPGPWGPVKSPRLGDNSRTISLVCIS